MRLDHVTTRLATYALAIMMSRHMKFSRVALRRMVLKRLVFSAMCLDHVTKQCGVKAPGV